MSFDLTEVDGVKINAAHKAIQKRLVTTFAVYVVFIPITSEDQTRNNMDLTWLA